jgi:hypothetical protein
MAPQPVFGLAKQPEDRLVRCGIWYALDGTPGTIMLGIGSHDSRASDGTPSTIMLGIGSHDSRALDGTPSTIML